MTKPNGKDILVLNDYPGRNKDFMKELGFAWIKTRTKGLTETIFNCVNYQLSNSPHGMTIGY